MKLADKIEHISENDVLNAGREKINKFAIDPAMRAESNSIDAKNIANQSNEISNSANEISNSAKDIAKDTDNRLDNIISNEMQDAEVIDARRPFGMESYETLSKRLDNQIGLNTDFRNFENEQSFMKRVYNEFSERAGNPKWYGAKFDGVTDDTEAWKQCIAKHSRIDVPTGTSIISDTLEVVDKKVIGRFRQGTWIRMNTTDPKKPIFKLGRHATIKSMQIGFKTIPEGHSFSDGDFTAIQLNTVNEALHRGIVEDVIIDECGTGLYAPYSVFSSTFKDITIFNAMHKYMHFAGDARTGNVYSNIYMSEQGHNRFESEAAIFFEGEESEASMEQINIEHMKVKKAAYFENCRAFNITSFHIEGVHAIGSSGCLFEFINSNIHIGGLSVYYTRGLVAGQSMFYFGDSQKVAGLSNTTCRVAIENLFCKGLNRPNDSIYNATDYPYEERTLIGNGVQPYYFAKRDATIDTSFDYALKIGNFDWITWNYTFDDNVQYREFNTLGSVLVDFNLVNRYEKIAKALTVLPPIYYKNITPDFVGIVGNSTIETSGTLVDPAVWNYNADSVFVVNGVTKNFTNPLFKLTGMSGTYNDELNLISGEITKSVSVYEINSSSDISVSGRFFQVNLPVTPKRSINDNYSRCTHFPSIHYNTNYSALYLSLEYIESQGIINTSDSDETKISKFKVWLDLQKTIGKPLKLAYVIDEPYVTSVAKERYTLNKNIELSTTHSYISCKVVYHL